MFRIDGPGATNDNNFTEGDPANGTRATVVTAEWLNAVQEELASLVEGAGLELQKGTNDQLKNILIDGVKGRSISDVGALRGSSFPDFVSRLWLSGYHATGTSGSGCLYRDADDTTTADNGFTVFVDLSGVRWKRSLEQPTRYYASWAGVSPQATASENDAAFDRISSFLEGKNGVCILPAGRTLVNKTVRIPIGISLVGWGKSSTIIDASGSEGDFDDAVVLIRGEEPEQIAPLALDASSGDTVISFESAHNLGKGDVGLIYNPTDGSYSTHRPNYRAGEFFRVIEIVNATQIVIESPLYATYAKVDVNVYQLPKPASGLLARFSAIAPGAGTGNGLIRSVEVQLAHRIGLVDVGGYGSDNASLSISRCFQVIGHDLEGIQDTQSPGFGTQYGLVIGNSQSLYLQGRFIGYRHGTATGGNDDIGPVNREVHIHDSPIENVVSTETNAAADWHGNTEYSTYVNCHTNNGGFNIAGNKNRILGGSVRVEKVAVFGREIVGCDHEVNGLRIKVSGNPLDNSRNIIDIGGNGAPFNSETEHGGTFKFFNIEADAPNCESALIGVRNRGFEGGEAWAIVCDQVGAVLADGFRTVVTESLVSGNNCDRIQATNINCTNRDPLSIISAEKIRQDGVTGRAEVSVISGEGSYQLPINLPFSFAKPPAVFTALNSNTARVDGVDSWGIDVTSDDFTLSVGVPGGTFPNDRSYDSSWQAFLWEW